MSRHRIIHLIRAALLVVALSPVGFAHAQRGPATFTLGAATGRIDRGFSRITGAAELRDGRLVIADPTELGVFVLDLARRSVAQIGRAGPGPDEYERPYGVLRAPGDTLIVASPGGRFLRIDPAGRIAGPVRVNLTPGAGGMSIPRAIDLLGRYYWSSDFVTRDPQRRFRRNRAPTIKRWVPGHDSAIVVATFADHAPDMTEKRFHPYAERDAWVVAPDGRVGVLVAADYRLRWIRDGRVVGEGGPIPFERIVIGRAERDAYRDWRARMPAGSAQVIAPSTSAGASDAARRQAAAAYPDDMFPRTLPPFEEDGAWLSPGGEIWVARSRAANDAIPVIDVLDPSGTLRGSLRLPAGRRLLALEPNGVYLVHTDDDGLQWVERYAWPAGLR
ncbi:MAG TPA: hypothetical protein VLE53_20070 [Gemmatimonadaceae bacterium]|nr:hypothetical protein [Gemmatimonadaceae bacterium]